MDKNDALVSVFARNSFYKGLHYLALAALGFSLVLIGLLAWVLYYLAKNPTHPLYFVTDPASRLIEVVPVTQPNMTKEDVMNWAIEAAQATYSYDYVNFRAQLQSAQKYYTNYGWSSYMAALQASNNLVALKERKMIVQAKVVYPPTLIVEGELSGAYAWKFKLSMLATYILPPYDNSNQFTNPLEVTMVVQRQPEIQSYKGLGIVQIVGSMATSAPTEPQPISTPPSG